MKTGERFNTMLEDLGLSRNAFAGRLGVSSTAINGIVTNQANPGHKILSAIKKEYPQYNTDWLLTGKGEMKNTSTDVNSTENSYLQDHLTNLEEQFRALAEQSKLLAEHLQSQLNVKDTQIANLQELLKMSLGKLDLDENSPCGKELPMYPKTAA